MKAIFGVVSLLIVLAVVGIAAKKQLQTVNDIGASLPPAQTSTDTPTVAPASSSTVHAQSQQLQQRMADDVNKALRAGAARGEAAEK